MVNAQNRANLEKKLEKFLAHAQNKPDCAAVLVLVDADNDCPVTEAKKLSKRCQEAVVSVPVQVVYAHREFESWLLASIESIRGNHGISENAFLQVDVEAVSNPKKWITDQMPHGMAYKETTHQAALAGQINLNLARMRSRSFQRLCHALEQLVAGISPS